MIKLSFYILDIYEGLLFGKMFHWSVDSSNARNWYTNKWTLVIQQIKPLSNWSEQPFTQAASTFDYVVSDFCHSCLRAIPLLLHFGKYRLNWSRQEINRKRVILAIRAIVRILSLPRIRGAWSKWLKGTKKIVFLVLRIVGSLV